MTTLSGIEHAAQLNGAATAWTTALRPTVAAIDALSEPGRPRATRDALELAAEHVRIAWVLLEAVATANEPHTDPGTHDLDEHCLIQRTRDAAL